jgi:hypothetical protein
VALGDEFAQAASTAMGGANGSVLSALQPSKRMVLHDRVLWLLKVRTKRMDKHMKGIHAPGKFVHIDAFWADHLMYAFSECDDWATLLKTSPTFRNPKKR